ncbi:hypothetical protein LZ31DRAFT_550649 [Colletotrichum somersetense]|nr:hypothetical protein LZ31DRAFT_550649 [Colletotrichum somersetense]
MDGSDKQWVSLWAGFQVTLPYLILLCHLRHRLRRSVISSSPYIRFRHRHICQLIARPVEPGSDIPYSVTAGPPKRVEAQPAALSGRRPVWSKPIVPSRPFFLCCWVAPGHPMALAAACARPTS